MENNENNEPKVFPASKKKLKKARDEGNVENIRSSVIAFSFFSTLFFIFSFIDVFLLDFQKQIRFISTQAVVQSEPINPKILSSIILFATRYIFSVIFVAIISSVIASVVLNRGLIFSLSPLAPNADRLNPATRIKTLFSSRSLWELAFDTLRVILYTIIFSLIIIASFKNLLFPLFASFSVATASLVFQDIVSKIAFSFLYTTFLLLLLDLYAQNTLYKNELKMTKKEVEDEQKKNELNPEIKSQNKKEFAELTKAAGAIGLHVSTIIFTDGYFIVGIRYLKEEGGAPIVSYKTLHSDTNNTFDQAKKYNISVVHDDELTEPLFRTSLVGKVMPPPLFLPVIEHIVANMNNKQA